jgi:FAD/FMN-containing dehydrogenase
MTWRPARVASSGDAVFVSVRNLAGIDAYEPEDLTVTVDAGTSLFALQDAVGAHGQFLPLDPPALDSATVGACVATASAGPLRALYGTPRDHVLGLDIVTGDGRLLHFGGRVVKNVAGYDMVRPIVGCYGALGVITRVSVRLRPRPMADETLAFAFPSSVNASPAVLNDLADATARVGQTWPVAACELIASPSAAAWTLLVRLHGHPAEVSEARARLAALLGTPVASDVPWSRLSMSEAGAEWHLRLTAPVSDLGRTLEAALRLAADVPDASLAAHAVSGVVRVWSGSRSHQDLSAAAADMASVGGTCVCTVGSPSRPARPERVVALETGMRRLFDPAGILPPFAEAAS